MAVMRSKLLMNGAYIEKPINLPQDVIGGHMCLKVKVIKQPRRWSAPTEVVHQLG